MDDEFVEYIPDEGGKIPQAPIQSAADALVYVPPEMESMYAWGRLLVMLGTWKNAEQQIALDYQPEGTLRVQAGRQTWCLRYLPEHGGEATEAFFALLGQHDFSLAKLLDTLRQANLPQQWDFGACGMLAGTLLAGHGDGSVIQ